MHAVQIDFFTTLLVICSCVLIYSWSCLKPSSVETHLHLALSIILEFLLLPPFSVESFSFSSLFLFYLQFLVTQHVWIYLPWRWSSFSALLGSMSHVVRTLCFLSSYPEFSKSWPATWILGGFYLISNRFLATWEFLQCRQWALCLCQFLCYATEHENAFRGVALICIRWEFELFGLISRCLQFHGGLYNFPFPGNIILISMHQTSRHNGLYGPLYLWSPSLSWSVFCWYGGPTASPINIKMSHGSRSSSLSHQYAPSSRFSTNW